MLLERREGKGTNNCCGWTWPGVTTPPVVMVAVPWGVEIMAVGGCSGPRLSPIPQNEKGVAAGTGTGGDPPFDVLVREKACAFWVAGSFEVFAEVFVGNRGE